MATVYLALGSNVGDPLAHIAQAIQLVGAHITQIRQAPLYVSKAVGYTAQPDFVNTAISGQTDLAPEDLLEYLQTVEQQIGRTPSFHWGPREIDIDIIFYDHMVMNTTGLTLPHPRFRERDFVLQPLCNLNPLLADPVSKQTVAELLAKIDPAQKSLVKRVDA